MPPPPPMPAWFCSCAMRFARIAASSGSAVRGRRCVSLPGVTCRCWSCVAQCPGNCVHLSRVCTHACRCLAGISSREKSKVLAPTPRDHISSGTGTMIASLCKRLPEDADAYGQVVARVESERRGQDAFCPKEHCPPTKTMSTSSCKRDGCCGRRAPTLAPGSGGNGWGSSPSPPAFTCTPRGSSIVCLFLNFVGFSRRTNESLMYGNRQLRNINQTD